MIPLTLEEIAITVNGTLLGADAARQHTVTNVITDSRLARDGSLFVPIKGARADGHDFIAQVFASGAACAFSEKDPSQLGIPEDCPCILVDSAVRAMQALAALATARAYRQMRERRD